jgi:hypothetical protein
MNQSLNLVQDLEFAEAADAATTVVGGLSIIGQPIIGQPIGITDWEKWFQHPRRPVHPPMQPVKPWPPFTGGPHPLPIIISHPPREFTTNA